LGSTEGLISLAQAAAGLCSMPITSWHTFQQGLQAYRNDILLPLEWPAMLQAHGHVSRHEARELVALDQRLGLDSRWRELSDASARIGQRHLRSLRPLKDHRVVQRYLHAVEQTQAQAWHPLVYGAILGIYSLPLRQGLLNYAWISLQTRALAAASHLDLPVHRCAQLAVAQYSDLPRLLDVLLNHIWQ
jgi:urease accessory protein UreF